MSIARTTSAQVPLTELTVIGPYLVALGTDGHLYQMTSPQSSVPSARRQWARLRVRSRRSPRKAKPDAA